MNEYKILNNDIFDSDELIRKLAEFKALGGVNLTGNYLIKYLKETIIN